MTDAEALEQAQTWLFTGGEASAEVVSRLLTLATASVANTVAFAEATAALGEAHHALLTLGITAGTVDARGGWSRVAPDGSETPHDSLQAAAEALWQDYQRLEAL